MSRGSRVAEPGLAPPVLGDATDEAEPPYHIPAFPFDAGPYDRLPPLGATSTDPRVVRQRAVVLVLLTWIPPALLSAWEGFALGGGRRESFLLDVAVHARYLIALPLLVLAERTVLARLGSIVRHFVMSGIVPQAERRRFAALVMSTRRRLTSPVTMIVILALAYASSIRLSELVNVDAVSTWAAPIIDGQRGRSMAGWWRALVSQPLYTTIVGLWLWRALLWAHFLFKVSRLDLRLVASHPDHMGGLKFVVSALRAFPLVAFALATAMAGNVAASMLLDGRSLMEYAHLVGFVIALVLLLFMGPLLALRGPLKQLRVEGTFSYGEMASDIGHRFERRWLRPGRDIPDEAMEASDFSAVTDMYSIVANVDDIKFIPFDLVWAAPLVVATLLPFVPLLLAAVPVSEVLKFAANVVL